MLQVKVEFDFSQKWTYFKETIHEKYENENENDKNSIIIHFYEF